MLTEVLEAGPEKAGEEEYSKAVECSRSGGTDPKKAAALAVFLASSESDGISGRLISAVWDNWSELAARQPGAEATTVWQEAVSHPQVEAVIVATTNDWLAPITKAAVEEGKHVLVEKRANIVDLRDARAVLEIVERIYEAERIEKWPRREAPG